MELYNRNNVVNLWDNIISKEEWEKLYDEVREKVLYDLFRDKYAKMVLDGSSIDEKNIEGKKVISGKD